MSSMPEERRIIIRVQAPMKEETISKTQEPRITVKKVRTSKFR